MGRLRHRKGIDDAIRAFSGLVFETEEAAAIRGNWNNKVGNSGRITLELGTGKGQYLCQLAKNNPTQFFIGLEKQAGVLIHAAQKAFEEKLPNLVFIWSDVQFLSNFFAPGELGDIHINFCDPWPKARHAKRRLTHPLFLEIYRKLMPQGGQICLKTDNADLFDFSVEQFIGSGLQISRLSRDLHKMDSECRQAMTEYEEKFCGMGLPIHYCCACFRTPVLEENN